MTRPRRVTASPTSWSGTRRSFPDVVRRAILRRRRELERQPGIINPR